MASKIVCRNIEKIVNDKVILRGVNLQAKQGEVVALLGPNGAGKTTTFSILCGMVRPSHGTVHFDSTDITDWPMYKRSRLGVGYLPQESSIFQGLTVEDNIKAALEMSNLKKPERKVRLEQLLSDLSLGKVRDLQSLSVSGGERRKLEIARALALSPKFILLDEPLAGIDPLAVQDMRSMIISLKNKGIGIIITDHNVRDTIPIVDYAYILFEGKVLAEGIPDEIVKSEIARKMYFGEGMFSV